MKLSVLLVDPGSQGYGHISTVLASRITLRGVGLEWAFAILLLCSSKKAMSVQQIVRPVIAACPWYKANEQEGMCVLTLVAPLPIRTAFKIIEQFLIFIQLKACRLLFYSFNLNIFHRITIFLLFLGVFFMSSSLACTSVLLNALH